MKTFLASFVLCTAILVCATAKLTVLSPQSLATKFDRQAGIDFRVIQFGQTHFGAHFVGMLALADPIDACSPLKPLRKGEEGGRENKIAVAMSGGCQDSTKIRNAEQAGAKMILLINDNDRLPEEHGSRQGYQNFNIPLVLISRTDGDFLLEYMQRNTDVNAEGVFISMNFPSDLRKKTVNIDFWFSAAEKHKTTVKFLTHLREILEEFGDSFVFTPHYVTWTCATCKLQSYTKTDNPDCISGGRYCNPDPDDSGPLTGKDIVLEDLRQMCIWRISQTLWWQYVIAFEKKCKDEKNVRQCGTDILSGLAMFIQTKEISKCIDSSFITTSSTANQDLDDNKLFQQEKALQTQFDVTSFPMLYINYKPYFGKISKAHKVYEEICKELHTDTEVCQKILNSAHKHHHTHIIKDIAIVLVLVALFGTVVLLCYRRLAKREYKQMTMEANNLVSNYFAMEDKEELEPK